MATKSKQTRVIVALNPPKQVLAILALAKAVRAAIAANPGTFKSPVPPLAQLASDTAAFDTAQQLAETRVKGSVEARDAQKAIVLADLHALRAYVQTVVDADPSNGASIAALAGMSVRATPKSTTSPLSVKPNKKTSGSVDVRASLVAPRSSHEWEYSIDGGKTYVSTPPTLQAKTTITGLVPGSTVSVRHRAVTKTGPDDWSQPVSITVV
jgi:hypothetical protein